MEDDGRRSEQSHRRYDNSGVRDDGLIQEQEIHGLMLNGHS